MKRIFVLGEKEKMKNYDEALAFSGGEGVFSPWTEEIDKELALSCSGLLLPGGVDVHPSRYGEENTACGEIIEERDEKEIQAIKLFVENKKPILGICRGIQVLNVALGGSLYQDIATAKVHQWDTEDKVHTIKVTEESFLYPLYGKEFSVNSAHHQAAKKVADCLTATAYAEDSVIEALENKEMDLYGVQFHPERMAFNHQRPDTVDGRKIFEFFLGLCK